MTCRVNSRSGVLGRAFSRLIEVAAVITGLIIVPIALLTPIGGSRKPSLMFCKNNLSQLGVGYAIYANENNGMLPWQISTNKGGSKEYVNQPEEAWRHFWAAGTELANPRILVCPADKTMKPGPQDFLGLGSNQFISYFIGVASSFQSTNSIVAGDADIISDKRLLSKNLTFSTNRVYNWGKRHEGKGVILLSDRSVPTTTSQRLNDAVASQFLRDGK